MLKGDNPLASLSIHSDESSASASMPSSADQTFVSSSSEFESEEILLACSDSSKEIEMHMQTPPGHASFPFKSFQELAEEEQRSKRPTNRCDDSEVAFFHDPISFNSAYAEANDSDHMPTYDREKGVLKEMMVFSNFNQLKQAVLEYHIHHEKQFRTSHKKATNWRAVCIHAFSQDRPCGWALSASKLKGGTEEWVIKKLSETHVCIQSFNQGGVNKLYTRDLIANLVRWKIRTDPHHKVKNIQRDVKDEYGLDVKYSKAWYARQRCFELEFGKFADSYAELSDFLMVLMQTNPGTVVEIQTMPSSKGLQYSHFLYAFWAFKPSIDGFRYCIPVIAIEGTHLYEKYKGHLLLAVGMNANREVFLLAYSIVDSDNGPSWTWFMRLLSTHIFPRHGLICIISDIHAGIDAAFRDLHELHSSRVHHRYRFRHLRSNVLTKFKHCHLKSLIWEAGTERTRCKFQKQMNLIRANYPGACNYLEGIPAQMWALSHDGGYQYGIMTTNLSESFNNSLKGCRMLPVTTIVRQTFHKISTMFANRRGNAQRMQAAGLSWPKNILDELANRQREASNSTIQRYNDSRGLYAIVIERRHANQRPPRYFEVCLEDKTCNCGRWNVDRLPCAHVIAACNFKCVSYEEFVPPIYSMEYYTMSYAGDFYPSYSDVTWNTDRIVLPPQSAMRESHPGPQQTSRYPNEMDYGNTPNENRCAYCHARTHASRQCPTLNS